MTGKKELISLYYSVETLAEKHAALGEFDAHAKDINDIYSALMAIMEYVIETGPDGAQIEMASKKKRK